MFFSYLQITARLRRGQCFTVYVIRDPHPHEDPVHTYHRFGLVKVEFYYEKFPEVSGQDDKETYISCQGMFFESPLFYTPCRWTPFLQFKNVLHIQRYPRAAFDFLRYAFGWSNISFLLISISNCSGL